MATAPDDIKLPPKQRKFVEAYSGNGTEAARFAGYSHPEQQASRLLRNAKVVEAIRAREDEDRKRIIWTREERLKFWTEIADDSKQSTKDRLKASELLGRANADFTEKVLQGNIHDGKGTSEIMAELDEILGRLGVKSKAETSEGEVVH